MTVLYPNLCCNAVCYKGTSVGCYCPCLASLLIEYSLFIMLCLGSIEMDCVISESCYKYTILQRNYRKMTI